MQPGNKKNHGPKSFKRILLLLALTVILFLPQLCLAAMDEGRVRAAVIFHIITLTQWPEPKIPPDQPPHIIVLGEDPEGIATILAHKSQDSTTANKSILRVTSLTSLDEATVFITMLADCQVLYLTQDGLRFLPQIRALVHKRPILTIGETEEFCRNDTGMICLTIKAQKLAIQINHKLTSDIGFHFSAELLRHTVLIENGGAQNALP